jgi:hypothetical protein
MFLYADLRLSTENKTGLSEVRKIEVGVTDLNNEQDCEDMEEDCVKDDIYYFFFGECLCFG